MNYYLNGCNNLGIKKLCLAHNFDDQIETYYMRKKEVLLIMVYLVWIT